jgi:hypothetical protein
MNARTSAFACLLTLTAPSLLTDFGLPCGAFAPSEAHAQDKVTELAREKFMEGVKAFDAGKFDQARTLFLQAYALKRHPAVLLNLGQSELKAGYIEDGGNHLQQFLREHKTATADQKTAAQAGVADAQKKTAFLIVIVDADGADVGVDGRSVGKAPLLDPVFVKPGKHEVSAALRGKTTKAETNAKRGTATPVTVNLGISGTVAPPVVVPVPVPAAVPAPVPAPAQPPPGYPPPGPVAPAPVPGMGMGTSGPDTGGGGRQGPVDWFVDTPGAWVGVGLVGVGLIGSIGFGIAASAASSNADDLSADIQTETTSGRAGSAVPAGRQPCGPEDQPQFDLPHYADGCAKLRDNIDTYDSDIVGVAIFGAIGGAAAIGTVIYYVIDSDGKGDSAKVRMHPIITADTQGLGLVGTF